MASELCAVCFCGKANSTSVLTTTLCGHIFHEECVRESKGNHPILGIYNPKCPTCGHSLTQSNYIKLHELRELMVLFSSDAALQSIGFDPACWNVSEQQELSDLKRDALINAQVTQDLQSTISQLQAQLKQITRERDEASECCESLQLSNDRLKSEVSKYSADLQTLRISEENHNAVNIKLKLDNKTLQEKLELAERQVKTTQYHKKQVEDDCKQIRISIQCMRVEVSNEKTAAKKFKDVADKNAAACKKLTLENKSLREEGCQPKKCKSQNAASLQKPNLLGSPSSAVKTEDHDASVALIVFGCCLLCAMLFG